MNNMKKAPHSSTVWPPSKKLIQLYIHAFLYLKQSTNWTFVTYFVDCNSTWEWRQNVGKGIEMSFKWRFLNEIALTPFSYCSFLALRNLLGSIFFAQSTFYIGQVISAKNWPRNTMRKKSAASGSQVNRFFCLNFVSFAQFLITSWKFLKLFLVSIFSLGI